MTPLLVLVVLGVLVRGDPTSSVVFTTPEVNVQNHHREHNGEKEADPEYSHD